MNTCRQPGRRVDTRPTAAGNRDTRAQYLSSSSSSKVSLSNPTSLVVIWWPVQRAYLPPNWTQGPPTATSTTFETSTGSANADAHRTGTAAAAARHQQAALHPLLSFGGQCNVNTCHQTGRRGRQRLPTTAGTSITIDTSNWGHTRAIGSKSSNVLLGPYTSCALVGLTWLWQLVYLPPKWA